MKRLCPDYYEHFTCIAGACPITCCQEWKIAVDDRHRQALEEAAPPADVEEQKKNLNAYTIHKDGGTGHRIDPGTQMSVFKFR